MSFRAVLTLTVASLLTVASAAAYAGLRSTKYPPAKSVDDEMRTWHLNQAKHWRGFAMQR